MLRKTFHDILRKAIKKYITEVDPEIENSMMSYMMEEHKDGKTYLYNLQVSQVDEFPIWMCKGGSKPPKNGCGMLYCRNSTARLTPNGVEEGSPPRECEFCGGTRFLAIESLEDWRDMYE